MDEGILSLKWNNHNSTFIHTLSTLHKMEMYSDVTLACEGKYFPVHKLVLSICSEYFEEILSRTKCQHPVVVLKDIKHNDLEALLNYMYAGEANVAQSELANLIKAAECLRIKGLAVPDETPPVRDKRRHLESSESPHYNKKRRSEDTTTDPTKDTPKHTTRDYDTNDNIRVLENPQTSTRQENPAQIFESHSERQTLKVVHDKDSNKRIPEILLEGQPVEVKQEVAEPKIETHDDPQQNLEASNLDLDYDMSLGEEESGESDRHGQSDSHASHIIQDLMSHSVPGPSGIQGHESITQWESGSNNLSNFSVDNYSSDEGRNPQMDASMLGRGTMPTQPPPHQTVLECPYCPRAFLYRSDLTRHLRSHTGEKPFTCPFCAYRGTQKTHLHEHIKRRHKTIFPEHHEFAGPASLCHVTPTILHLPLMQDDLSKPASPPLSPSSGEQIHFHSQTPSNTGDQP